MAEILVLMIAINTLQQQTRGGRRAGTHKIFFLRQGATNLPPPPTLRCGVQQIMFCNRCRALLPSVPAATKKRKHQCFRWASCDRTRSVHAFSSSICRAALRGCTSTTVPSGRRGLPHNAQSTCLRHENLAWQERIPETKKRFFCPARTRAWHRQLSAGCRFFSGAFSAHSCTFRGCDMDSWHNTLRIRTVRAHLPVCSFFGLVSLPVRPSKSQALGATSSPLRSPAFSFANGGRHCFAESVCNSPQLRNLPRQLEGDLFSV